MADVFWSTYPIVLTSPAKSAIPVVVVTEQDIDVTVLTSPDKSTVGDAVGEIEPSAIAAGFFFDGASFTDFTTEANEPTANDVSLLEDTADFFYVGEDSNFDWIVFNIGTAGTVGTFTIEYSTLAGWSVLPSGNYASVLNNFRTAGFVDIFISAPSDWDDQAVNGETRRWIRFNCSGNYTIDPLATQIWTNTISTNRFLTVSDVLAVSDGDAANFIKTINQQLVETLTYEDRASGFYFSFGLGSGFVDIVSISDLMGVPWTLAVSDSLTVADIIALLNGPRLNFADSVTFIDAVVIIPGHETHPSDGITDILANPPSVYGTVWMGYIAIGTGTTEGFDTGKLENEVYRKAAIVFSIKNTYFAKTTFGQDEPTADDLEITEIGLFDDSVSGNMTKRWFLNQAVDKDNIDEIPIQCSIVFLAGEITGYDNSLNESLAVSDSVALLLFTEITLSFVNGFTHISCPGDPLISSFATLFATQIAAGIVNPAIFAWDDDAQDFVIVSTFEFGIGYVVQAIEAFDLVVQYQSRCVMTKSIQTGFAVIGSVDEVTPWTNRIENPAGSVDATLEAWNPATQAYEATANINPGVGHFVTVNNDAVLTIQCPSL